jgi:hypothetical protein
MSRYHETSARTSTDPTHNRVIHCHFTDGEQMALSARHALVAARTDDTAIIERIRMDPNGRVIALDIDECSVIEADTYDILLLIQKLTDFSKGNLSGTSIGYCKKSNQSKDDWSSKQN